MSSIDTCRILVLTVVFAALTVGCTHEYQIRTTYQRELARLPSGAICAKNESISISVVNGSPDPLNAGKLEAGPSTLNHRFFRDPALAFKTGLTAALRDGHCATANPSTATLQVVLDRMQAHGQMCGFFTCDGTADATVSVTLLDTAGRTLLRDFISTNANAICGLTFCSEEDSSKLGSQALSEAVGKTVAAVRATLAKQLEAQPAAEKTRPKS